MHRSRLTAASLVALAALILTGCTGDAAPGQDGSIATDVYPGLPEDATGPVGTEQTTAVWLADGRERFAIVTWGSSSCPPVATELTVVGPDAVSLSFGEPVQDVCTADMAATTHEFVMPAEVTERPVLVDVAVQGLDGFTQLTLP